MRSESQEEEWVNQQLKEMKSEGSLTLPILKSRCRLNTNQKLCFRLSTIFINGTAKSWNTNLIPPPDEVEREALLLLALSSYRLKEYVIVLATYEVLLARHYEFRVCGWYETIGVSYWNLLQPAQAKQAFSEMVKLNGCENSYFNILWMSATTADWSGWEDYLHKLVEVINLGIPARRQGILGFPLPIDILSKNSELGASEEDCVFPNQMFNHPFIQYPNLQGVKIKVGFLSHDLRTHPVFWLVEGLIDNLCKNDLFEVFIFATNPENHHDTNSSRLVDWKNRHKNRIFWTFGWSDKDRANLIYNKKIDILIDLQGPTGVFRNNVPSYRPSPIQILFLGYSFTAGGWKYDYMIADRVVVPEKYEKYYSEKLILMPDSYMPTNHPNLHSILKQKIPDEFSKKYREDLELKNNTFVFCNFNQVYKYDPETFKVWIKILKRVPNSVLWIIYGFDSSTGLEIQNLRKVLEQYSIEQDRFVVTNKIPFEKHLVVKASVCDLLLDTVYYNGHASGAENLWAGIPILTFPQQAFPSRVAASLLKALDVPELITYSYWEYEERAVLLANNRDTILKSVKDKIWENRFTKPLFDLEKYSTHFELGLKKAFENHFVHRLPPENIVL